MRIDNNGNRFFNDIPAGEYLIYDELKQIRKLLISLREKK